jgi:hypothetical protein
MTLMLDFEGVRTPLFVRQTIAVAFGIPLGQEFTWNSLTELVCIAAVASPPRRISVLGLAYLGVVLPEEADMVGSMLRRLRKERPSMAISVALNG